MALDEILRIAWVMNGSYRRTMSAAISAWLCAPCFRGRRFLTRMCFQLSRKQPVRLNPQSGIANPSRHFLQIPETAPPPSLDLILLGIAKMDIPRLYFRGNHRSG